MPRPRLLASNLYSSQLRHDSSTLQVGFPLVLDMYDLCTPDFRKQLDGPRLAGQQQQRAGVCLKGWGWLGRAGSLGLHHAFQGSSIPVPFLRVSPSIRAIAH